MRLLINAAARPGALTEAATVVLFTKPRTAGGLGLSSPKEFLKAHWDGSDLMSIVAIPTSFTRESTTRRRAAFSGRKTPERPGRRWAAPILAQVAPASSD